MTILTSLLLFGVVAGQVGVVTAQVTAEQLSKMKEFEPPKFQTEVVDYFGDKRMIWDHDQDGWDDLWCMIHQNIKHRSIYTDTDEDGVTDYEEMILWRDPFIKGPLPKKLTPEELAEAEKKNKERRAEQHAKDLIRWEQEREARAPFTLTGQTREKHKELKDKKEKEFMENARKNPVFSGPGHDSVQGLEQIIQANGSVSVSPAGYGLTGAGVTVSVMEESVSSNHVDFTSTRIQTSAGQQWAENNHTTAVSGIIASSGGINASGRGVAPGVTLQGYQINPAVSAQFRYSILAQGFSWISNHSYGPAYGWTGFYENINGFGLYPLYNGNIAVTLNDPNYCGQYRGPTQAMDAAAHLYPLHTFVTVAGNNRSQGPGLFPQPPEPNEDQKWFYSRDNLGHWVLNKFESTDPLPKSAGESNFGFDSLTSYAAAKNPIVAGALNSNGTIWTWSGYGPTDDGRIKPDLMARGSWVVAPYVNANGTSLYANNWQGTSFAAPVVTGAAALVTQQMHQSVPSSAGAPVRSDVLKAIMIHTADDIDLPGPDYRTGWGALNIDHAVELVRANGLLDPFKPFIKEFIIQKGQISQIKVVVRGGTAPFLKATLVWNDPEGQVLPGLDTSVDVSTKMLVNDLDLYVYKPDQTIELPYAPNPSQPLLAALRGVNTLDNVEQVYMEDVVAEEVYMIVVDGTKLTTDSQAVSLVFTGNKPEYEETKVIKITDLTKVGEGLYSLGWQSRAGESYTIQKSLSLGVWEDVVTGVEAIGDASYAEVTSTGNKAFWRVVEE